MSEDYSYFTGHGAQSKRDMFSRPAGEKQTKKRREISVQEFRDCSYVNCDNTFLTKRKDAGYCCNKCYQAQFRLDHTRESTYIATPKPFCARKLCTKKASESRYKYCSKECADVGAKERSKEIGSPISIELAKIESNPRNNPHVRLQIIASNSSTNAMRELLGMKLENVDTAWEIDYEIVRGIRNQEDKGE